MPAFEFRAKDGTGAIQTGMMHGASLDVVARQLSEKGWTVESLGLAKSTYDPAADFGSSGGEVGRSAAAVSVPPVGVEVARVQTAPPTEARSKLETDVVGPLVGMVPLTQLHLFFRQLHSMLHAGINPAQALDTLANQRIVPKFRTVLLEAKEHVLVGRPMSVGFQRYPEVFSPLVMSMVRVGEEGGFLSEQCQLIANYLQQDIELRNLIRRETAYPKIILAAAAFIIFGANAYIASVNPQALGLPTPWVAYVVLLGVVVVGWFAVRLGKRQPAIMRIWDTVMHALPWVGNTIHGFAMAKFGRAFGALHSAGVPLAKSAMLAADASGNEWVKDRIYPQAHLLDSGEKMADVLQSTGAFSPMIMDMLRSGEMTGNIEDMLVKVSELYEDEGTTKARQMALVLGVFVFLVVAIFILVFIIMPFYMGYATARTSA